jgi:hypothetical protein
MEKKCESCNSKTFTIEVKNDCAECEYNGWYDGSEYRYGSVPNGNQIDQAYQEGECKIGTSYNAGCWLVKCATCGKLTHMPTCEAP